LVKIKYPSRKILTQIDYPENAKDLEVSGNEGLLEIAIKNLIDNACKFSEDEVIVKVKSFNNAISVMVTDAGIGIPETEKSEIVKPFRRASNSKFIGGFGVGLSIVSRILEIHRGVLKITNNQEKGCSIEIMIDKSI
jgi:signal transduction histidine kinase